MNVCPRIVEAAELPTASPVSPPTVQEFLQLASLVPLHAAQTVPSSVPEVVSSVFRMCRNRWVADFLFSSDMTPLSALTAPVNLSHAISCTVTMTSVERDIGLPRCSQAPPNPFDTHMHGDYVFIPAFSVGSISVGFGIQNCAVKCQSDWGLRPGETHRAYLGHFRYVRDDEKGILVNIRDGDSDCYKIDYMAHGTATKRRRSFLTIERDAIQKLLREDTAGLDPQKLLTAIRLVQTAEEFRDCPFCGTLGGGSCDCKLQPKVPKHPLDFDNMPTNMGLFVGSFEGVTASSFCTLGMERMSARLGSRITIDCAMDTDVLERLSKWAITDKLKSVKEDPLKCIMPSAHDEMADTGFGMASNFGSGETTEIDMSGEIGDQDAGAVREMNAFVQEMTRPAKDVVFADVSPDGLDTVLGLNKGGLDNIPTQEIFEQISPETTRADDVELTNEIAREAQLAYQAENTVREHSAPSGISTTRIWSSNDYAHHDDGVQSEEAGLEQEKERKAELRRQRNREAAQRSNAKRKEKNDTLKAALRDVHTKAAELRAKELVLREENIRLRKMLSSS